MELYSMPQLDKSAAYPEHVQYEEPLGRSPVNKFGPVSGPGDILASSAWSAIIHHPAEDSEPDELPSTVDMDAIKVSTSSFLILGLTQLQASRYKIMGM
ncbi:hypothetical protein J6590_025685 [Homalodisca vitripennis]|nr:hypothetical protein J6590_025685 [Homalodisca vitripennis]